MLRISARCIVVFFVLFVVAPQTTRAATCREIGQPLLVLSDSMNALTISALRAGSTALSLTGTRSRYGPSFKRVEDEAAKGDQQFLASIRALDELQAMQPDNPTIAQATSDLLNNAKEALQASAAYNGFALAYERAINHQNRSLARAAFAAAMGSMAPYATSWSTTNGSLYGNTLTATTTTHTTVSDPGASWRSASERYNTDALSDNVSLAEMQAYLTQYEPTIYMLPYNWFPITKTWVAACRKAGELSPG